jgi:serine O-acetyltransferase
VRARERWRADLERYYALLDDPASRWARIKILLDTEPLWAIGLYRFGQYLYQEAPAALRRALGLPYQAALRILRMIVRIHLYPSTRIGPGLYIGHPGGIWVSPEAELGAHCNLSQGVTIGIGGTHRRGAPVLGDRVWVGPNATLTGPIRIGSGAVIAANSLAASDVPENGVAVGVPARTISRTGSAKLLDPPEPSHSATETE